MRPAEFRAGHVAIGASTAAIAERAGVHSNTVWRWEDEGREADVPERAQEVMREMLAAFDSAADRLAEEAVNSGQGYVPWHTDADTFARMFPELAGWGGTTQQQLVVAVQQRLLMPVEYER